MIIKNKLQRQGVTHKCKIHKFRRFTKKNKTFYTDRYYCMNCGYQVLIEQIYGHQSICCKCDRIFNITELKVYPTCPACSNKKTMDKTVQINNDWLEGQVDIQEKPEVKISDMVDMLLDEAMKDKKPF